MGFRFVSFFLVSVFSGLVFGAASESELRALFEEHYHKYYRAGSCGKNAFNFVASTKDPEGLYVVKIEDLGGSLFGMLNVEAARGFKKGKPINEERNFYHHIFLVDERGLAYDFDFTIEPTVLPIQAYLEQMYLNEEECKKPVFGEFCVGRKKKMSDYQLTSFTAAAYLDEDETPFRKAMLHEVVKDWKVLTAEGSAKGSKSSKGKK